MNSIGIHIYCEFIGSIAFQMEPSVKIYEEKFKELVRGGVQFVQAEISEAKSERILKPQKQLCAPGMLSLLETITDEGRWEPNPSTLKCSYCRVEFPTPELQRDHYKLDWHRYNLKLGLEFKQPVTEEEFNEKTGKYLKQKVHV